MAPHLHIWTTIRSNLLRRGTGSRIALWMAASATVAVLVACGTADAPSDDAARLVASGAAGTSALDGETVSGDVTIEFDTPQSLKEVHYHLDDADEPAEVARTAPFSWVHDTRELSDGAHVLDVRTAPAEGDGGRVLATARFVVANGANEEPDDTEPDDAEETIAEADYFVSPSGSDDGSGSVDDPFWSLRAVADVVEPGDVVLLRGGVYDDLDQVYLRVRMSGAAGAPVTVRSYPGEHAVFDGGRHPWHPRSEGDGRTVSDPMLLWVTGDHLVFEDVTFRNSVGDGFYFVGYHNVLRNVTSHDHHGDGLKFQGSFNLLEYVTSFGNNSVANGGNSADGISITDGNIRDVRSEDSESRGNVIRYALLYDNSDDGIDVWNSWETLIEYSVSFDNGIGPTGNGEGFKLGGGEREDIGTVARFNLAWGNKTNFNTNTSTGVTLLHNTSWAVRDAGIGFALTTYSVGADENRAYNNLSFEDRWPRARGDDTDDRFNSWNLGVEDPEFVSLDVGSSGFLALGAGSEAVDAGMDVGLAFADGEPDLGALQVGDRVSIVPTEVAELGRVEWRLGDGALATR